MTSGWAGGEWAWSGGAGPAPGVLMAVSLCRAEDEDLLPVSFIFLSFSDDDVHFYISVRIVWFFNLFLFCLNLDFQISSVMTVFKLGTKELCCHVVFIKSLKS